MFAESAFDHVVDSHHWHLFDNVSIYLPFPFSKYVVLMFLAAALIILIYVPIARRAQSGAPPRGAWWNCFEFILTFLRDQVAKPCIGPEADRYMPLLWTIFLFVLFCNLLGLVPFMGSPTASISVTGALAVIAFIFIHGSAIADMGAHAEHGDTHGAEGHDIQMGRHVAHETTEESHKSFPGMFLAKWRRFHKGVKPYLKSYFPHMDVPFGLGYVIIPFIGILELVSNLIKAFVLAVRLFANMFAGHVVLAFILLFIVEAKYAGRFLFWGVTFSSVLGVTALSLLELFVGFLQAYVFVFLTALFLGAAMHPQH